MSNMKSYDAEELLQDDDKPVKKNRSYDIDIKSTKKSRSYNISVEPTINKKNRSYDINDKAKTVKDKRLSKAIVFVALVIVILLGFIIFEFVLNKQHVTQQDNNTEAASEIPVDSDFVFTDIDASQEYIVAADDALVFPCDSVNTDKRICITYSFSDVTTDSYYYDNTVYGGENVTWVPSDYIRDTMPHTIAITQTAYNITDTTRTKPLGEKYTEIIIRVSDDNVE